MKKIRVEDAVGRELCHDITAITDSFKGAAFKRGHIIEPDDVPKLLDIGKRHIYIWEDEDGEIHEEDAARRLADAIRVDGARWTEPSEGKVLLISKRRGLFVIDRDTLARINSIGEITIACMPNHYHVEANTRLASARVVPLAAPEREIVEAERLLAERPLFELLEYRDMKVGIIITGSEIASGRTKDRFEPVLRAKLATWQPEIMPVKFCTDEPSEQIASIREMVDAGADLLLLTGGMSVDPDDNTPDSIRAAGAEIISHGVPAQPGNMTLVAYIGHTAVMGVPGAAAKLPTTILDVLLPQMFTGRRITREDLLRLAEGGLCQLCGSCHWPNCTFGRY